ncbi:hypothetical protein Sya03_24590 [Spirilliplanes yamanashiensis]|uniref:Uncharacterized protein n=1 Tax=Spirilliplanes yamanashiensis TaxID=42233 RepID=A0A8J3Y898_9ACTN|nr:hypothetical protein Sya03_24590 [Spirilliplanes yamanashiensis]
MGRHRRDIRLQVDVGEPGYAVSAHFGFGESVSLMPLPGHCGFRTLVDVTTTDSGREPSMTRQTSTSRQHRVLCGAAVLPVAGRSAGHYGEWSYLGRWRD